MRRKGGKNANKPVKISAGKGMLILEDAGTDGDRERWVMPNLSLDDPPCYVFESIPAEVADQHPRQVPEFLDKAICLAKEEHAAAVLVKARPDHQPRVKQYGFRQLDPAKRQDRQYLESFRPNDRRQGSAGFVLEI